MCRECFRDREYVFEQMFDEFETWICENGRIILFKKIAETIDNQFINFLKTFILQTSIGNVIKIVKLYHNSISPTVRQILSQEKFEIDFEFKATFKLSCNIMKHELQPKVKKCKNPEVIQELYKYMMPQYTISDPVCIWMDFKIGDIISICENKCNSSLDQCCVKTRFRKVVN
jgi:DNA-directed RNA polymerase subunit H (RpoH/RPB5)